MDANLNELDSSRGSIGARFNGFRGSETGGSGGTVTPPTVGHLLLSSDALVLNLEVYKSDSSRTGYVRKQGAEKVSC